MRPLACLVALLVAPVALLWLGWTAFAILVSLIWLAGVLMLFFLWAGPGIVLAGLAGLVAAAAILFGTRRRTSRSR